MTGIEALHDAIMAQEGWKAGSRSNRNRNPGNLRASAHVTHTLDDSGYCVFRSILDGSDALLCELHDKITGANEHGISQGSTLDELFDVYAPRSDKNNPNEYAVFVAQWCSTALSRGITHASTLGQVCPELNP